MIITFSEAYKLVVLPPEPFFLSLFLFPCASVSVSERMQLKFTPQVSVFVSRVLLAYKSFDINTQMIRYHYTSAYILFAV